MSREITLSASVQLVKNSLSHRRSASLVFDQDVEGFLDLTQAIGTTNEAIDLSGLSTPGWSYFRNLDGKNCIDIGPYISSTFYPFIRLPPGGTCTFRLAPSIPALRAQADTAESFLEIFVLED